MVRKPAVAGMFYPKDPLTLHNQVQDYLKDAENINLNGKLKALIVPHAGYPYSGIVAAQGYKFLEKMKVKKVILLGPSHHLGFYGASLAMEDFSTPLGIVKCADVKKIIDGKLILNNPQAHAAEHSLEVQLPFLQETLGAFELYAFVLGAVEDEEFTKKIFPFIDKDTLIIASSDLSHYQNYDCAVLKDNATITHILHFEDAELDACGELPIRVLMKLAAKLGWKPQLIDYRNSGDTAGDKSRVVGYATIAFTE